MALVGFEAEASLVLFLRRNFYDGSSGIILSMNEPA